ncbi:hypothetical protein EVA_06668 [gut metagenome]|uniref:Uncharacterized protein n=1 Tax=gut metagenome TaxID=749906 RepID=J9GRM5_9ZZZZ
MPPAYPNPLHHSSHQPRKELHQLHLLPAKLAYEFPLQKYHPS